MQHLTRRDFASILTTLLASGFVRPQGSAPQRTTATINRPPDRFLQELPRLMEVTAVPAIAFGIIQNGKLAWQRYEGVGDVTSRQPVTADSLFPAASLGKPVFAYGALLLADEGKLDLDRPLKAYVPDHAPADPGGDKVSARHVLSHSTGYRNWRNSIDQPLVSEFEPGSRFQYSGEGFYYLQRAVEKISGRGIQQFMDERLFGPFGMSSCTFGWRADTDARLVVGHNRGNPVRAPSRDFANRLFKHAESVGKPFASFTHDDVVAAMAALRPAPPALPNFMVPNVAGGLLTTLGDYAAFVNRLLVPGSPPKELARATRDRMFTPITKINSALSWGLGWGLEHDKGRDYIWHWGDNGNYKNFVLAHLPSQSAVVVFTNGNNGMRVAEAVVGAASGHPHFAFDWL